MDGNNTDFTTYLGAAVMDSPSPLHSSSSDDDLVSYLNATLDTTSPLEKEDENQDDDSESDRYCFDYNHSLLHSIVLVNFVLEVGPCIYRLLLNESLCFQI